MKRIMALVLALFVMCMPVYGGFVEDNTQNPQSANIGGEWAVIGMAAADTLSESAKNAYLDNLEARLKETGGVLSERKYTEYSRAAIALKAVGENPESFRGYNLLVPLLNRENVGKQGINGTIFALIALNGTNAASEEYINTLLGDVINAQTHSGAVLYGGQENADITSMALCAFAPYMDRADIRTAAGSAVNALASMVNDDGYIENNGVTSESISQAIIGLTSVGINPESDPRFVRKGKGLVSRLEEFKVSGGYSHLKGDAVNSMASEQGLCAVGAYRLYNEGKGSLYYSDDLSVGKTLLRLLEVITGEK